MYIQSHSGHQNFNHMIPASAFWGYPRHIGVHLAFELSVASFTFSALREATGPWNQWGGGIWAFRKNATCCIRASYSETDDAGESFDRYLRHFLSAGADREQNSCGHGECATLWRVSPNVTTNSYKARKTFTRPLLSGHSGQSVVVPTR